MIYLYVLFSISAHADLTAFEEALKNESAVQVQERWVEYGGTMYREVEYRGEKYYVKFTGRQGEIAELECRSPTAKPNMIQTAATLMRRTKLFVSFLSEHCKLDEHNNQRTSIRLDPRIGFTFPDDPHFPIKDRSIYWMPVGGMPINGGIGGTW